MQTNAAHEQKKTKMVRESAESACHRLPKYRFRKKG